MLILSGEDVKQVLDIAELFEALKEGFRLLAEGQWKVPCISFLWSGPISV